MILYYIYVEREMQAFCYLYNYLFRHYHNITGFDIKNISGYSKVKTVRVYVWAGLTIIFSFEKEF